MRNYDSHCDQTNNQVSSLDASTASARGLSTYSVGRCQTSNMPNSVSGYANGMNDHSTPRAAYLVLMRLRRLLAEVWGLGCFEWKRAVGLSADQSEEHYRERTKANSDPHPGSSNLIELALLMKFRVNSSKSLDARLGGGEVLPRLTAARPKNSAESEPGPAHLNRVHSIPRSRIPAYQVYQPGLVRPFFEKCNPSYQSQPIHIRPRPSKTTPP